MSFSNITPKDSWEEHEARQIVQGMMIQSVKTDGHVCLARFAVNLRLSLPRTRHLRN